MLKISPYIIYFFFFYFIIIFFFFFFFRTNQKKGVNRGPIRMTTTELLGEEKRRKEKVNRGMTKPAYLDFFRLFFNYMEKK